MRRILILIFLLLLLPGGVLAQGDDGEDPPNQFFTADGSLSVQMPTNWQAEQGRDFVVMSSSVAVMEAGVPTQDNPWVVVFLPDRYSDVVDNYTDYDDPEELANDLREALLSQENDNEIGEVTLVEAEEDELGGYSLTTYVPEQNVTGLFRVFDLGDGKLSIALLATVEGQMESYSELYEAILSSITYNPPVSARSLSPGVGIQFDYPPEWEIDVSQDLIIGLASSREALREDELISGEVSIVLVKAASIEAQLDNTLQELGETPVEIAENFITILFTLQGEDVVVEPDDIESGELELASGFPAAYAKIVDMEADGYIITIDLGEEEGILIIFAATPPNEIENYEEDVLFIAESVQVYDPAATE